MSNILFHSVWLLLGTFVIYYLLRYFFLIGCFFGLIQLTKKSLQHFKIYPGEGAPYSFLIREAFLSSISMIIYSTWATSYVVIAQKNIIHLIDYSKDFGYFFSFLIYSAIIMAQLVLYDFYFYIMHYLMHRPRFFKYVHKVHHQSRKLNPWSSFSFNPIETIIDGLGILLILLIFRMEIIPAAIFIVLIFIWTIYIHLGYEFTGKIVGKKAIQSPWLRWISTPTFHYLHHARYRYNYGFFITAWDYFFKTADPLYEKEFTEICEQANKG